MDTSQIIILSFSCAVAGGIFGMVLTRIALKSEKGRAESKHKKQSSDEKLELLQLQITDYINQTSHLLNNIQQCSVELSNHIESGAQQLGLPTAQPDLPIIDTQGNKPFEKKRVMNPPLDYSPKKGEFGTLSEDYGLKDYQPDNNK